ncbi:hypothetical protein FE783_25530 [Paenibacillus mesophilus]|uniref:hypothetical protein n=1 Tax=Paenibacillus mesophilus TaxID=2582849 RepID=UPI00110D336C|nr:hypothetical protein [Paenibacillus mesophilus]TMV46673.1 hypothetical protein FE783_25530 [Paenibacillus mesophilus]
MTTNLVWFIVIVSAFGLVASIVLNMRQQRHQHDRGTNDATAKHPFMANPIIIAYVLFPIVIVVGAAILMMYS